MSVAGIADAHVRSRVDHGVGWMLAAALVGATALLTACPSLDAEELRSATRYLRHRMLHFGGDDLDGWVQRESVVGARVDSGGDASPVGDRRVAGTPLVLAPGERFESAALEVDAPFYEALASWNVTCPEGAGFRFELGVRRADSRAWSPWLHLGEWGAVDPTAARTVEFDGGRIDVDFLSGDVDFDAVRFAVVAERRSELPIEVERVSLCLTSTNDAARTSRSESRTAPLPIVALDVPFRSQRTEDPDLAPRLCSPTCVAMVLSYHGVERTTADVAALLYDARHDIYGNWPRAVQGAFACGVPGYLGRFSDWSEVEALVARGVPLVVSVRVDEGELRGAPYTATPGHLLVLAGFDALGDVVVNDPAAATPAEVRRTYRRADLTRVWLAKNGVAYVLGDPNPR